MIIKGRTVIGPQESIVTDGLVMYLDAANPRSYPGTGTSWYDMSGRNTSTLVNGPTYSNGNFLFNGTDEYCYFDDSSNYFDFSNSSFTVSFWIKTSSANNMGYIKKGTTDGWGIAMNSGIFNAYIISGSSFVASRVTTQTYNTGSWINVSVTFTTNTTTQNLNNVSIYINNQLDQGSLTSKRAYGGSTGNVKICSMGGSEFFMGNLSSIQIHNRSLTVTEILQNFNALKTRYGI
jgi:hypothetical protein